MRKTLLPLGRLIHITRAAPQSAAFTASLIPGSRHGYLFTLTRPLTTTFTPIGRAASYQSSNQAADQWKPKTYGRWETPANSFGWRTDGGLGQTRSWAKETVTSQATGTTSGDDVKQALERQTYTQAPPNPENYKSWEQQLMHFRQKRDHDSVWHVFLLLQKMGLTRLLAEHEARVLRDEMLTAALQADSRTVTLFDTARKLNYEHGFEWPDLYTRAVYFLLDQGRYEEAIRCHIQLVSSYSPRTEDFGALISSFVVDPTPQMQSTLTTLYVLSTERQLYDYIVPVLFASGQSKLARIWRKKLLAFKDLPASTKSQPFLRFITGYYPSIPLARQELIAARLAEQHLHVHDNLVPDSQANYSQGHNSGQYNDSMVARWFASSWTSVEFAINLVHRLGLRVIGPRSLQSLALRETDAKGVASRIRQTEELGIEISSQAYCNVLVFFAKHGQDDLLKSLLTCDIHPDEFEDPETRQMLMAAAVRERDWRRERLLQRVEWAIDTGPSSRRLNSLLRSEFSKRRLGRTRLILDRMEALRVPMAQNNATDLLERTFIGLAKHPAERPNRRQSNDAKNPDSPINRAIDLTRRIACHGAAIPIQYWKLLLYNLGRLGRFDELEQLCVEVVQFYTPPYGGLIPVHKDDFPQSFGAQASAFRKVSEFCPDGTHTNTDDCLNSDSTRLKSWFESDGSAESLFTHHVAKLASNDGNPETTLGRATSGTDSHLNTSGTRGLQSAKHLDQGHRNDGAGETQAGIDSKCYIPADLPFTHREHPVQKIFDAQLQRSIVRWGFDQTLALRPGTSTLLVTDRPGTKRFDVACGVSLLALLRDQGVLIDTQVLRATILSRVALGQVPGRRKDRSRDDHEISAENIKRLVDEAWGSEVMPNLPEMVRELERQKPKLWSRYPRLFRKAFDRRWRDYEPEDG